MSGEEGFAQWDMRLSKNGFWNLLEKFSGTRVCFESIHDNDTSVQPAVDEYAKCHALIPCQSFYAIAFSRLQ